MAISHIKSNTIGDFTGTVTVFDSLGSTVTAAATDLVRPSDWNSAHNLFYTLAGNTAGSSAVSGTDVAWVGGNNVTLSADTANSRIVISAFNQTNQTAASGNIAGVGFTTTTAAGAVVAGTNDTNGLKLAVPAFLTTQSVQTQPSGNIVGQGFTSTTTAGTNVVGTLNSNGLSIGVPAYVTAAAGGGDGYNILAVNGGATQLSSTYTLSNSNNVTFGLNAGVITASASQSVQTQASGNIAGTGFSSTTTAGTAVVGTLNTAGLSIAVPQFLTTYVGQTTQTQPAGNIAGVGTTFAGTNISASMTLNTAGLNLALSGPAAGGGAGDGYNILAVNAVATQLSTTYTLSNGNNVSFGIAAGVITASASQSVQTQPSGNIAGTGFTSTTTAGTAVVGTLNTAGLSLGVPAYLTTAAQSSASNVSQVIAATNNTGGGTATLTGGVSFSAANNITFYTSAGNAIVASFSSSQSVQTQASGNIPRTGITTGATAGSLLAATHDTAGISLGVPAWITTSPAQTNQTGNFYVTANSTQLSSTAAIDLRSVSFAGAGIASVGVSNGVVLVSVPAGGGGGDGYNIVSMLTSTSGGGTAGATFSALSGSVGLMAGSNITLSQTSNTIVINGPAAGGGGTTQSWWQPEVWGSLASTTFANGTVYVRPFELDAPTDADMLILQQSISSQASSTLSFSASVSAGNASSGSGTYGQTMTALWFSRVNTNETNASYNSIVSFDSKTYSLGQGYSASVSWSTNASSATASVTTSWGVSYINNIDSAGNITTSSTGTTGSTSFSSTSTNANSFSSSFVLSAPYAHVSGIRPIYFPQAGSNVGGGEYWLGLIQSTNTGSTNMSLQRPLSYATVGIVAFTGSTQNSFLEYGNSANLSTSNIRPGYGSYSASSNTTAAIPLSQVSILGSNASVWFAIAGRTK